MTHSLDFRKKEQSIKEKEGLTLSETAIRFNLGVSSIQRCEKYLDPKKNRNKPATKIKMNALDEDVKMPSDGYQYERAARLGVSQRAIGNALKRMGVRYKKNTQASESRRKGTAVLSRKDKRVSN